MSRHLEYFTLTPPNNDGEKKHKTLNYPLKKKKRIPRMFKKQKVSEVKRRLSTLLEEIGNMTGHKSLSKIRPATLPNRT